MGSIKEWRQTIENDQYKWSNMNFRTKIWNKINRAPGTYGMMSEVLTLMSSEFQKRKISAEKLREKMGSLKPTNWRENINLSKVQSG